MPVPVVCPVYYPTRPNSSLSEVGLALYTRFRERYTTRERRAVEVVPGVHQIPGVRWSRAYLIEDDKLALVDAGPFWTARRIERYIRSIGRHPGDLAYVLMTHSHPDHAGSVRSIVRKTGAHVFAHPHDTAHNPRHGAYLSYMGMIDRLPFLRADVHETVDDGHRLPHSRRHARITYARPHTGKRLVPPRGPRRPLLRRHRLQRRQRSKQIGALPQIQWGRLPAVHSETRKRGVRLALRWPRIATSRKCVGQAQGPAGRQPRPADLGPLHQLDSSSAVSGHPVSTGKSVDRPGVA